MIRIRSRVAVAAMLLIVVLCSPVSAASSAGRSVVVLHLHFRRVVARACPQVMTSGGYTLVPFSAPHPNAMCAGLVA